MYTKEEIFKDIQKIMNEDYAGYIDIRDLNHPERYTVANDMSEEEFLDTIKEYLLDFNDGHLWFGSKKKIPTYVGFSVRRYEDALYVIDVSKESSLIVGDVITLIDGVSIKELGEIHQKRLKDTIPERQNWNAILNKSTIVQVTREDQPFVLDLSNFNKEPIIAEYSFKQMDSNTAYIKLTDFAQESPIREIIKNNKETLENSENLIIDVRVNWGGNDSFYFPLLDYIFDQPVHFKDLFAEDQNVFTNHTERNYQLWIPELKDYLTQELDDYTRAMLEEEITIFEKNRGRGLIETSDDDDYLINGHSMPENVYVLSDVYCGSSGDTFVENVKKSPKVTVVGRSTMGIIDYINVVTVDYGEYEFVYSIAKMNQKYATNGIGISPDIYIPWTPDHLKEDKDLTYVLELIKSNSLKAH